MAWCPNCKNEYRPGITVCPDCNVELLEELKEEQAEEYVLLFQTDDEAMKSKVTAYLAHCGIHMKEEINESSEEETEKSRETIAEETEETDASVRLYSVYVPKKDVKEATKEMRTVLYVDAKQDGPSAKLKEKQPEKEASSVYVEAKDRYQEYRSSGFMFLGFAVALLVFDLCNMFGILSIMNSPFSLVMMTIMVAAFFFIGISSLKKTSSLKEEAAKEETQSERLRAYLAKEFPKEVLDAMAEPELSEEILYLKQMDAMKEKIMQEYPELPERYLDTLLEDYYNSL